jgi:hypothetical protein
LFRWNDANAGTKIEAMKPSTLTSTLLVPSYNRRVVPWDGTKKKKTRHKIRRQLQGDERKEKRAKRLNEYKNKQCKADLGRSVSFLPGCRSICLPGSLSALLPMCMAAGPLICKNLLFWNDCCRPTGLLCLRSTWLPCCLYSWPLTCLSAWLSNFLITSLPYCASVWTLVCLATCLSAYLPTCLPICLSAGLDCLPVWILDYLSAWLPVWLATWLPVCFTACLPDYLSAGLSVCLAAMSSWRFR